MNTTQFTPAMAANSFAALMPDKNLRDFLATAARYVLTPRDLFALGRMDEAALEELGLSSADFDDLLAATWRNHE